MRPIKSRVSRCRSSRSPNSGEMISFHSRGSALSCHSRSFEGISTPVAAAENPVLWDWREALSLAIYLPCARQCPVTRLLE